jgi:hypothetical protein
MMNKGILKSIAISLAGFIFIPAGVNAHHAFAAEFDRNQPVDVSGQVSKIEWTNPHARIYVDAEDESGEMINWNFEMGSPNNLMRQGWRRDTLEPGDSINISGWRARNAPYVGNVREVSLPDGSRVFAASSGGNN